MKGNKYKPDLFRKTPIEKVCNMYGVRYTAPPYSSSIMFTDYNMILYLGKHLNIIKDETIRDIICNATKKLSVTNCINDIYQIINITKEQLTSPINSIGYFKNDTFYRY